MDLDSLSESEALPRRLPLPLCAEPLPIGAEPLSWCQEPAMASRVGPAAARTSGTARALEPPPLCRAEPALRPVPCTAGCLEWCSFDGIHVNAAVYAAALQVMANLLALPPAADPHEGQR